MPGEQPVNDKDKKQKQKDSDLDHDKGKGNDFKAEGGHDNGKDKDKNKGKDVSAIDIYSILNLDTAMASLGELIAAKDENKGKGSGKGNSSSSNSKGSSKGNGSGSSNSKIKAHDDGKDKVKGNDNGGHKGWDKNKLKKQKGNRGKHLGWYKRADHPKNSENIPILNKPDAYEIINYINDVSLPNTQVLMTSDKEGVYRGVYTYGLERISERDLVDVEGNPHDPLYYLYDGRGSVTQMMTPAEHPSDKYRYDPYGVPMPGGKLTPNTKLFNNPYGYNAEAHDIDSGLQYLRARYYEPEVGGFLTRDSYLGDTMKPLTLNKYIYTSNNPLMYKDPSGHMEIVDDNGLKSLLTYI